MQIGRLSPRERIIAWRIALRPIATADELITALWGDNEPDDPRRCLWLVMRRFREKLRPAGLAVRTVWGVGYSADDRPALLDALAKEIARNVRYGAPTSKAPRRTVAMARANEKATEFASVASPRDRVCSV